MRDEVLSPFLSLAYQIILFNMDGPVLLCPSLFFITSATFHRAVVATADVVREARQGGISVPATEATAESPTKLIAT